uniref:Uncharacterized protein n=1 Tax=Triticum urartu TaxID=4572 RepID=A0A8R7JXE4_TRIUA
RSLPRPQDLSPPPSPAPFAARGLPPIAPFAAGQPEPPPVAHCGSRRRLSLVAPFAAGEPEPPPVARRRSHRRSPRESRGRRDREQPPAHPPSLRGRTFLQLLLAPPLSFAPAAKTQRSLHRVAAPPRPIAS